MILFLFLFLIKFSLIVSSIETIETQENKNITITCYFNKTNSNIFKLNRTNPYSSSDNIILWYKDNTQVIGVNSISNDRNKFSIQQIDMHTYQLTIFNVQLESSGLYKCQNFTAKQETHFRLNVLVPPTRIHLVSSVKLPVNDGTLVSFNCTSERVYPNPIFEWYKNDKLIQRSIGNQTDSMPFSSSSILTLLLTPVDHNHILRCQVSNQASVHETNLEIKLDVLFKPIIKIFYNENQLLNNLTIIENTLTTIICQISSNPIVSDIEWYKDGQLITGENQEEIKLNFTNIKKLTCRARNSIGQIDKHIYINIIYQPKLSMIDNVNINEGETLVLKCLIDSNPLCNQIRWLFNGNELTSKMCTTDNFDEYKIENIQRTHSGTYACEIRNSLNSTFDRTFDGLSQISTYVQVEYAPFILNSYKKLAIVENEDIKVACIIDAYPKADVIWFSPTGQVLNTFTEERSFNNTVTLFELNLPSTYSTKLGFYRCLAKNKYGRNEFSIDFQRPTIPDPPEQLRAFNLTHSSFIINWQTGYDGGSDQIFYIYLNDNHTEEIYTHLNWFRFDDLNEKTRYKIRIRSKNDIGFSNYSSNLIVMTNESPIRSEEFPIIERAYFTLNREKLHFKIRSTAMSSDDFCIQQLNNYEISTCIPLNSFDSWHNGLDISIDKKNLRFKICLTERTDICSKSILISSDNRLINNSSELILILTGGILGLCFVFGLIIIFICIYCQKEKRKSKNGSTDTLKTNIDNVHSIQPVHVSDTNSCLYFPSNQTRTIYFNDDKTGIYSIQDKKNSMCFDSGIPSINSNKSDSIVSQILTSSDTDERSDGEYLVNRRTLSNNLILSDTPKYTLNKMNENQLILSMNARISSEEESGFSTPTKVYQAKKLVYEVVV